MDNVIQYIINEIMEKSQDHQYPEVQLAMNITFYELVDILNRAEIRYSKDLEKEGLKCT